MPRTDAMLKKAIERIKKEPIIKLWVTCDKKSCSHEYPVTLNFIGYGPSDISEAVRRHAKYRCPECGWNCEIELYKVLDMFPVLKEKERFEYNYQKRPVIYLEDFGGKEQEQAEETAAEQEATTERSKD